jgi:hypothetical protein
MQLMMIYWLSIVPQHVAHISLPDSQEPQQRQPRHNTIGSDLQPALLMMGVKAPETC